MKQTNNAIKFLMAQYRAIFKNAYIKGMASALLLTAGLGLASSAQAKAPTLDAEHTHYFYNSGAAAWNPHAATKHEANGITAGAIAGDGLVGDNVAEEQKLTVAQEGVLNIGGSATGAIESVDKGQVAGGWAQAKDGSTQGVAALHNEVNITGSGFVDKGTATQGLRGMVFGGYAKANSATAESSYNTVTIAKGENGTKAAASHGIFGGYTLSSKGGIANNNTVDIDGTERVKQVVVSQGGYGIIAASVEASGNSATGTYTANDNQALLDFISIETTDNKGVNIVGSRIDLGASQASASSSNSYIELNNSSITTKSGGMVAATSIYNGSGDVVVKGNDRGLKITNSEFANSGDAILTLAGSYVNVTDGADASVTNVNVTLDQVKIADSSTKSDKNDIHAASVVVTGNVVASNNSVNITESSQNRTENTYTRVLDTNVNAAYVDNAQDSSNITIDASNNSISVGANTKITGDLTAARISASGDKVTRVTANNNSVSVAGEVVGDVISSIFIAKDTKDVSGSHSFLNNDVSLLNGATVSKGNMFGGAGKDSVISIAAGATYIVDNDVTGNQSIISDVIDIDGTIDVKAGKFLKIAGFYQDGRIQDKYNENLTSVGSSAVIKNAGQIHIYGKVVAENGAVFTGTAADSLIMVSANESYQVDMDEDSLLADEDRVSGADFGVLGLSSTQLKSYLTADKVLGAKENDQAGKLQLTSGGALELSDTANVDLSTSFNFTSGTAAVGQIQVDANATNGGSIIRGNEITISRQLASNAVSAGNITAATTYEGLTATGMTGLQIEANTLHLGASDLSSARAEDILFNKATAKEVINFYGLSNDKSEEYIKNDGFHLVSDVYGDNYMITTDQDTELEYYTALHGDINGDVTITNDGSTHSGSLTIQNGNWTAHDIITLGESGSLIVGGDDGIDETGAPNQAATNSPDATLTLDNALVINLKASTDASEVTVEGAQDYRYDFDEAAETVGDDRLAQLDPRNGLTMVGDTSNDGKFAGKATITATSGGVILLDSRDLNTILGQNDKLDTAGAASQSGAYFVANNGGAFIVTGDVEADFNDFNASGSTSTVNGITLDGGGYLVADSVSITNSDEANLSTAQSEDDSYAFKSVAWGDGTLVVDDLVISDLQVTTGTKPAGSSVYASKVTVTQGNAEIAQSLVSNNNTLILGSAEGNTAVNFTFDTASVDDTGSISVNNLQLDNGILDFTNGKWDATATTFALGASGDLIVGGGYGSDINDQDTYATLDAAALKMDAGSTLMVNADGTATFKRADFSALTTGEDAANVNVYGHLIITGDTAATIVSGDSTVDDPRNGVAFGAAGTLQIQNNGILEFGTAAVDGAIIADGKTYNGDAAVTDAMAEGYSKISNNGGVLKLDFSSGTVFDADAILQLKEELFTTGSLSDGVLINGGVLHIGDGSFYGFKQPAALEGEGLSGYTAKWSDVKNFSDIYGNDVTNTTLEHTNVSDIVEGDQVQGHWGSLTMRSDAYAGAKVTIAGHTSLNYATGNRGYFISNASRNAALGASINAQKSLKLIDGGEIGSVQLQAVIDDDDGNKLDVAKNRTTLEVTGNGNTIIRGDVIGQGAGSSSTAYAQGTLFKVSSNTEVTADIRGLEEVYVLNGAQLSAQNADASFLSTSDGTINIADTAEFREAEVIGGAINTKIARYDNSKGDNSDDVLLVNGGRFTSDEFYVVAEGEGYLSVGVDLNNYTEAELTLYDGSLITSGTGYFETGLLELNKGTLVVDPEYGDATSVAAVGRFQLDSRQQYKYENDKGVLEGEILIGKNAALGVGATLAETQEAIATYQENGSLQADNYGSILYLNGQLTLADKSSISLNADEKAKTDDDIREANKYVIASNKHNQYAALGLGANTAILMTEKAFEDAEGNKTGTAIYFDRKAAVVNGAGGDIILAGDFDAAESLNIFNDADNNGVMVEGSIDVRTQNGFLKYTLSGDNQGKDVQLEVDKPHAYSIMSEASNPVVETLIAYHTERGGATIADNAGDNTEEAPANPETTPATVTEAQGNNITAENTRSGIIFGDDTNTGDNAGTGDTPSEEQPEAPQEPQAPTKPSAKGYSSFLSMVSNNTHGAPAEAAARLAVYGGAVQAAMAASSSTTDAIAARMGVGASANITMANNGQGAALWLAPVYKTHDSDSFDAQGLDYGVDMNLYGLALGADFEFMPGLTAGIMFNVGSGDVDGQGNAAANNTSNDFDYWGAAFYGNYTYDALSVTADISYTAVDNDLEATTGMTKYGKLESSTDTTAISLGVTAKYTFDFGGVEVAPHAGLRYTNIDLDDYTVKAAGEDIAHYDADKINLFSIPVGVTFAKEFTADAWTVKPSLDLTLTGNFGDDDISGNVSWTGVEGLVTPVSSEYMDDFTYGATLGIEAASTSGFSLGLGVNYTGSSNVDEFGVQANARFVF